MSDRLKVDKVFKQTSGILTWDKSTVAVVSTSKMLNFLRRQVSAASGYYSAAINSLSYSSFIICSSILASMIAGQRP